MLTGRARELQELDPRRVRIVYEWQRWHEAWHHNPRIAAPGEVGDFQDLIAREDGLRPYIAAKAAGRWTWRPYTPPRGELYFTQDELDFARRHEGRIIVEPNLKVGASPNKDWGWANWTALSRLMRAAGIRPTQLGPATSRRLPGADFVKTRTMRHAAAVIARARAAVLPEGGLHHVAAAVGAPAVVIFGGFISPQVTGYAEQRSIFTGGDLGCGYRVPCPHCRQAMRQIDPEQVMRELEELMR